MSDDINSAINAGNNNGRQVMGTSMVGEFVNSSAAYVSKFVVPRKGPRGGAPRGKLGKRNPILGETLGAHYAPQASLSGGNAPEAGYTQANGRIIPSSSGVQDNFYGGSAD